MSDMRVNNPNASAVPQGDAKATESATATTTPTAAPATVKSAGTVSPRSTLSPTMSTEAVGGLAAILNVKNGRTQSNVQSAMAPTTTQGINAADLAHLKKSETAPHTAKTDDKTGYQKLTEKVSDAMPVVGWLMKGIGNLFGQ